MKILFVTATRIGDAVLSSGLLAYLVERHPGAEFTIAAGPLAAPPRTSHRRRQKIAPAALAVALCRGDRHKLGSGGRSARLGARLSGADEGTPRHGQGK